MSERETLEITEGEGKVKHAIFTLNQANSAMVRLGLLKVEEGEDE